MDLRGKKIYVGLSGGVDSAVSATLLKEAGARVTGVFIKGWYPPGMPCTWAEDRRDAMRVAAHLAIPFKTLEAGTEYKRSVIDYLLSEYRRGRTPNPDIMCNRDIKFGVFFDYAMREGADAIATGHYLSGEKDQRYFLWAVPKVVMDKTIFPVGHMEKAEVRRLARRYRLPNAAKKDSQGVCFLGPVSVEEFLEREFSVSPGEAVDERDLTVGLHAGAILSTIGERVALKNAKDSGPWFVLAKDIERNRLVVGKSAVSAKPVERVVFESANWLADPALAESAQLRYRATRIRGRVFGNAFSPEESIAGPAAPGQSIVFYRGEELVGGGIIA